MKHKLKRDVKLTKNTPNLSSYFLRDFFITKM